MIESVYRDSKENMGKVIEALKKELKRVRTGRASLSLLDGIKVFAYHIKAEMCRLLLKHYGLEKEVVPALAMIVERTGYVKWEGRRLEVTLRRFANREIDYAARHLCEDLNEIQPVTLDKFRFPIHFRVQ